MRFVSLGGLTGLALATLVACADLPTTPTLQVNPFANMVPDPTNPDRITYTFDELTESCAPSATSTGLYEDLVFPSPVHLAPCLTSNGTIGLMPSAPAFGSVEVRVQLPRDGLVVSVESFVFAPGTAPTLIAYDASGAGIGRASDGTLGTWVSLEVDGAGTAIRELGLLMPQNAVHLDNLTVTYPTTEPPQPTDPTTKQECDVGGWASFGFRNQGQCVRFLETGEDSREASAS